MAGDRPSGKLELAVVAQESKVVSWWWQLRVVLCNTTARKKCVPKDRVAIRGGPSFGETVWCMESRLPHRRKRFSKGSNRRQKALWPWATWWSGRVRSNDVGVTVRAMTEGSRQARTIGYLCRGGGGVEGGEGVWKCRTGTRTLQQHEGSRRD